MSKFDFREESKEHWFDEANPQNREDLIAAVNSGCFMRMADSLETIAKDKKSLEDSLLFYKRLNNMRIEEVKSLLRQNAALRGWITRLKKQEKGEDK